MAAHSIQMSDDDLLAEYVPLDDFKGVLEQRVAVAPDLLAMVIRDGKVASAGAGGNFGVGGIWRSVKDALIGKHSLRLLIGDLKPFQLITGLNAISRDKVPVGGEITMEFQINPERPAGILGMMREHSAVYKGEVLNRLAPHIGDRVIEAVVGQIDAGDLRGSTMVQDKVQAEVMSEVERIAGDMGLMVRSVSMRWEINAEEIAAIEAREIEREQERRDAEHNALKREVARASEVTALQVVSELDEEKVKAASEDELRQMVLDQELAFNDARDTGLRIQEMKALEHEIAKLRTERTATIEASLENATNEVDIARLRGELRQVERDTERLDTEQRLALEKLEKMQELEIARAAHSDHVKTIGDLQDVENRGRRDEVDLENQRDDAKVRREIELQKAQSSTEVEKLRAMKDMSPELVLAINAGVSPAVAEVLVEQAKAKGGDTAEKMALMREQIDLVKEAKVASAEQAKQFFETGIQGAVGVAQGAGGGGGAPVQAASSGSQEVECINPECRKMISVDARFCRHCGQQMRS